MKYVYLVCQRNKTIERNDYAFSVDEIEDTIINLRAETPYPAFLNVLDCCSSASKAVSFRDRFNNIDEYRFCQTCFRHANGNIYRVRLTVYDYFIVRRPLI